jgi:hypothetical protein
MAVLLLALTVVWKLSYAIDDGHLPIQREICGLRWGLVDFDDAFFRPPKASYKETATTISIRALLSAGGSDSLAPTQTTETRLLERLSVLRGANPDWIGDVQELELPQGVQLDDVLDAVVGLAVAQAIVDGYIPIRRFPESQPPVDEQGLRMEIWY